MLTLESLGITNDELIERVVDKLVEEFLGDGAIDDFGCTRVDSIVSSVKKLVEQRVIARVTEVCEQHVIPHAEKLVSELVVAQAQEWGKAMPAPVSIPEYAKIRTEAYLGEKVDRIGQSRAEGDWNWKGNETRLAYLVDRVIGTHIKAGVKVATNEACHDIQEIIQDRTREAISRVADSIRIGANL